MCVRARCVCVCIDVYLFAVRIDGLQSIPRDSNDKDVAAMLVELLRNLFLSFPNMAAMT